LKLGTGYLPVTKQLYGNCCEIAIIAKYEEDGGPLHAWPLESESHRRQRYPRM